jgi:hypothetical protein
VFGINFSLISGPIFILSGEIHTNGDSGGHSDGPQPQLSETQPASRPTSFPLGILAECRMLRIEKRLILIYSMPHDNTI